MTVAGRRGIGADQRMVGLGGKVEIEMLFLLGKYIRQEINNYQGSKYTYGNQVELDTQPQRKSKKNEGRKQPFGYKYFLGVDIHGGFPAASTLTGTHKQHVPKGQADVRAGGKLAHL
ncbi:MAG: hypothetical protein HQK59_02895 [Deltaproteobacteria bacterium]|nr:hypothetical protein [Deltaproteobacteria bacterium]